MNQQSFRWVPRSILYGFFLSVWTIGCLRLYEWAIHTGWPIGNKLPENLRTSLLDQLGAQYRLEVYLVILVVPAIIIAAWLWVEQAYQTKGFKVSTASISWAIRKLVNPWLSTFIITWGLLMMIAIFYWNGPSLLLFSLNLFFMLLLISLPFTVFRPELVGADRGTGFWYPKWPGLRPVLLVLSLLAINYVAASISSSLSEFIPVNWFTIPFEVLSTLFNPVIVVCMASILIFRLSLTGLVHYFSAVIRWKYLGPFLAVNFRIFYISIIAGIPVFLMFNLLATNIDHIYWLRTNQEMNLPFVATIIVGTWDVAIEHAVVPILTLWSLFQYLTLGRFVWLMRSEEKDSDHSD